MVVFTEYEVAWRENEASEKLKKMGIVKAHVCVYVHIHIHAYV